MAPVPDIHTDRYWADYEGPAGKHSMLFRFLPSVSEADAVTRITAVLNQFKTQVPATVQFNQVRKSFAGSNVSFPITWTPIVGTNATPLVGAQFPNFISYVGRDMNGVRTRMTLQGVPNIPDTDFRLLSGEVPSVAATLAALRAIAPSIMTVSGLIPIWNSYANTGVNAYFQRQRRKEG